MLALMKRSLRPACFLGFSLLLPLTACSKSDETSVPAPPPLPVESAKAQGETTPAAPAPEAVQPTDKPSEKPADAAEPKATSNAGASTGASTSDKKTESASKNDKSTGTSLYDLAAKGQATLPTTGGSTASTTPSTTGSTGSTSSGSTSTSGSSTTTGTSGTSSSSGTTTSSSTSSGNKVTIPDTANVKIEVPSGLQKALNADTRMQSWLNQVVKVIDSCYASERKSNASAEGTIVARVEMHENSRPDADIKTLPPALSGVVACSTGGLMRIKMPLFTGKEGETFTVNIRFTR